MIGTLRIGIDLGGTKIEGIVLGDGGAELARRRVATPVGDYAATIRAVADIVAGLESEVGAKATVGVGIPGTLSTRTGLVKNANSTCLIGRPLDRDLAATLRRPVRLANDANCFVLSEAVDGAGRGAATVFGVILGTGVGGGIVRESRVFNGPAGIAGEWGHNALPWPQADELPGPACYCGRYGCIETFLSGPAMAADHILHTGEHLKAQEIAARAEAGDAPCAQTIERYAQRLARGLAMVVNILDPDVIVLGGGLSGIRRLYERVPQLWNEYVFSDDVPARLLPPVHGDASGVRGAAWLWPA
jgi:fructokinase